MSALDLITAINRNEHRLVVVREHIAYLKKNVARYVTEEMQLASQLASDRERLARIEQQLAAERTAVAES
jgi:regulator of replication initiation timing